MAPPGVAALLALEVPVGPAADSRQPTATDHRDGTGEPDLGEERITDELFLKLGVAVSPRTVGRYLRNMRPSRGGRASQRWATLCELMHKRYSPATSSSRSPYASVWSMSLSSSKSARDGSSI